MKGLVYNNGLLAGIIEKDDSGNFIFRYNDNYFADKQSPSISLTLPKTQQEYKAEKLSQIFREYGEENWTKKIVEKILLVRKKF